MSKLSDSLKLPVKTGYRNIEGIRPQLLDKGAKSEDIQHLHLGNSEEGRAIDAFIIGKGVKKVSLIAGNHSDEPVGPETLREFVLQCDEIPSPLKSEFQFIVVPHVNPDGEARNRAWLEDPENIEGYLQNAFREAPGRDMEFGYPDMRVENSQVSTFLKDNGPVDLHMSLHGMGFAEGVWMLIQRDWVTRTKDFRDQFAQGVRDLGYPLHDIDRQGDKGFTYLGPGFSTTPESKFMKEHFNSLGDTDMAEKFHLSSMEYVATYSDSPLCLVTEIPLFLLNKKTANPDPRNNTAYHLFKQSLKDQPFTSEFIQSLIEEFQISPFPLAHAMQLQFLALELGLNTIKTH